MKLTLHLVLFVVAIVLFLAAAAITDGHLEWGNAAVVGYVALATTVAGVVARDEGH